MRQERDFKIKNRRDRVPPHGGVEKDEGVMLV